MSVTLTLTFANIDEVTTFLTKSAAPVGPLTSGEAPKAEAPKPKAEKAAKATPSAPAADAASAAPTPVAASGPKVEAAGEPAPAPAAKALDYMKDVAPKVAEAQTKDRAATIALLEKLGARGADGKLKGSNVPADKLGELVDGLAAIISAESME